MMNYNVLICLVWALFLQSMYTPRNEIKKPTAHQRINHIAKVDTIGSELTKCNVYNYAKKIGVKFPNVYIRQCIMESGHFTSRVCIQLNNIHGMHNPTVRKSTSIAPKGQKYAQYRSWKECVQDYKLWQNMHNDTISKIQTDKGYILFLRKSAYIAGSASYYERELIKIQIPKCKK